MFFLWVPRVILSLLSLLPMFPLSVFDGDGDGDRVADTNAGGAARAR
jgi:hypothetical protein